MGWTVYPNGLGGRTPDQEFREQLTRMGRYEVVASATVHLCEYYAAVRNVGTGEVWAFVALHRFSRGGAWGYKDMEETMGPVVANCPERVLRLLSPLPECHHPESYCLYCGRQIERADAGWVVRAKPGDRPEAAGPHCYSGFRCDAPRDPETGRPWHAPGGTPPCSTCQARDWRERCGAELERRANRPRVGERVRLVNREIFIDGVPEVFTVAREGRRRLYVSDRGARYRFPGAAEWERVEMAVAGAAS